MANVKEIIETQILVSPEQCRKKILGIGRTEMYNLCKTKGFPAFKIGSKYYINIQKLQEWADKQCK